MFDTKSILGNSKRFAIRTAKIIARGTMGKLPAPVARLTGKSAKDGGRPVRDLRFRPWRTYESMASTEADWRLRVGPAMKAIFRSGNEGLPQTLAHEFAQKWAEYCGSRYSLLLPHGTDALRIALAATLDHDGMEFGGEVIVPNISFIASATAVLDRRLGVALVDVDPVTLNIDPKRVEEAIVTGRTRAIMAVHLYGQPADMSALRDIAKRHSLFLIEDAAQAHGAIHELGRAGSIGDSAAFSFQSTKNLPCGEGGALTTDDEAIYDRALALHNVGRSRFGAERWGHETLGWNLRPTEYIAAVLMHRLSRLEEQQSNRHCLFMSLHRQLSDVPCIEPLGIGPGVRRHAGFMFSFRYHPEECGGLTIDDFNRAINAEGVPVGIGYTTTLAQQPALQRLAEKHPQYVRAMPTPVADEAVKGLFYIPNHVFLSSEAEIAEIAAAFRKLQAYYAPTAVNLSVTAVSQHSPMTSVDAPPTHGLGKHGAQPLRLGIIGVGVMGRQHAVAASTNPRMALVGVADRRFEAARNTASEFACRAFASPEELIQSGEIDTVIVATPHWQHAELTIMGLRAGLNVMCEKPLAVTVSQADEMLQVSSESPGLFGVVHQTRFEPAYQYAKNLLDSGELGPIIRCSMVETAWRTAAYYRSSPWRGTWRGEGGGVLLNQAPHVLDRYAWLFGMPDTVLARCDTNLHHIEVEDTASALLRHSNGAHGYIHVSTTECPFISRMVVSCDRGRLTIENGKMQVTRLGGSIRERTVTESRLMAEIEMNTREIPGTLVGGFDPLLNAIYDDFAAAAAGKSTLTSPGKEGRNAVELANAIILSSSLGVSLSLPLDRGAYSDLMSSLAGDMATICSTPNRGTR